MSQATPKFTFDQVRDAASGRWRDLLFPAFGIDVPSSRTKHGPCPICGGKDRFRCDDKQGKGSWICNQCGAGDGFALIEKARGMNYSDVLRECAARLGLDALSTITDDDRRRWRQKAADDQRKEAEKKVARQQAAREQAQIIWAQPSHERDCPYLTRKQVPNYGCKINADGHLIVPLYDVDGVLWNVQRIAPDGFKPYLTGGRVTGLFHVLGDLPQQGYLCIAEGYATAATVHLATGLPTVVTFQSGNIQPVATALHQRYPNLIMVYCADDDRATGDAGRIAAEKAMAITGGCIVLPDFGGAV